MLSNSCDQSHHVLLFAEAGPLLSPSSYPGLLKVLDSFDHDLLETLHFPWNM